eukprot:7222257-Pyramimonas_sp.AAC.1
MRGPPCAPAPSATVEGTDTVGPPSGSRLPAASEGAVADEVPEVHAVPGHVEISGPPAAGSTGVARSPC